MTKKRYKIRLRILIVISIMLFSSFSLIGIIFNIAVQQYIQNNAITQLDRSYHAIQRAMEIAETILLEFPSEYLNDRTLPFTLGRNDFRIASNMFVLDAENNILDPQFASENSIDILEAIKKDKNIDLNNTRNKKIHTAGETYYISSHYFPILNTNESGYWVIYADITGLSNFAHTINVFFIVLVCVMFIVAVFVSFFLSNTIIRPIKKLCALAVKIGNGDFTPKDYDFKDREFENLNRALNKSAKQLGNYDIEQKAFFQNVSHELRTPLMSIQCYAEGISCGLMEPKKASDTILQETNRLTEMVKDLLYISKIDNITTTFTITNIDLAETIRECVKRQQAVAEKKNIRFVLEFDEPAVYFSCAGELVSRAIENILSNAIRYAKSQIIVSCGTNAENIEIRVRDDGDGIGEKILPHVFERFYKGEGGDYGIGLSIVKTIIEQHGGIIWADNSKDGGAVFTINLPCENKR